MAIEVTVEQTPNPNSRKFVVNATVSSATKWYANAGQAAGNALAEALFAIDGVATVMLLNDFATVGKTAAADWDTLQPAVEAALRSALG